MASEVKSTKSTIENPFSGEKEVTSQEVLKNVSDSESKDEENVFKDDGEDLPDNFFDDFSNNDFMAGLDIVDDWNDDDVDEVGDIDDKKKVEALVIKPADSTSKRDRSPYRSQKDHSKYNSRRESRHDSKYDSKYESHYRNRRYNRRSREDDKYIRDLHRRRSRSRNRHRSHSRHNSSKNILPLSDKNLNDSISMKDVSKDKSSENNDRRRDPEKTKRDIQRDKIRCAKDQEARVFQEQLKVAETGLVPPGTELDVILSSEKFKENVENEQMDNIKDETRRKDRKIETGTFVEKRNERISPIRIDHKLRRSYGQDRFDRDNSHSIKRRRRYSRSCERKNRSRSRSKYFDDKDVDLRHHLREKRERYLNDLSPVSDRRISRSGSIQNISPVSAISERESWLRNREFKKSRQGESCSPVSSKSLSDKERPSSPRHKRSKKFSFMEELEIKLRQNVPSSAMNKETPTRSFSMSSTSNINTCPVPVPPPQEYFHPNQMNMSFNQNSSMFLSPAPQMCPPPEPFQHPHLVSGNPSMYPLMNIPCTPTFGMNQPLMMQNMQSEMQSFDMSILQNHSDPPVETSPNWNQNTASKGSAQFRVQSNLKDCNALENQRLEKLFEDKKITLSDFLSVSAKSIDSSTPVTIHNKIKVISRCEEAIRLLEDQTFTGRFVPKLSQVTESEKCKNLKLNQSPMRKAVVVRFNFTVLGSKRGAKKLLNQPSLSSCLHKLTTLLGLLPREPLGISPVAKIKNVSNVKINPPIPVKKPVSSPLVAKKSSFVQTDPMDCKICEIRKARKFTHVLTQTTEKTTFDIGTQVSIEDLNKSCTTFVPRGILKNSAPPVQSISHLTPAQLLAQLENEKKEENLNKPWSNMRDSFSSGRSYADHASDRFSPENNMRATMSTNYERFNDPYRNINPFSDNYMGSEIKSDRYGGSFAEKHYGSNVTPEKHRPENMNRGNNFGPSPNDRNFDNSFNANRHFSDMNPSFSPWGSGSGRGNARGFGGSMPNKYFN